MFLVNPSIEFIEGVASMELVEKAARTCYKSEGKIEVGSAKKIYGNILRRGHDAMTEFGWIFYKIICDRGVTHEIVRHRLFSYAQESTRYCNYKDGVNYIISPWFKNTIQEGTYKYLSSIEHIREANFRWWFSVLLFSEEAYLNMLKNGESPQQARSVLPNSLKTEICIAGNVREWRHFFKLRCAKVAHPQMREVAVMLLCDAVEKFHGIFDDLMIEVDKKLE